jgi:hypothetical protein
MTIRPHYTDIERRPFLRLLLSSLIVSRETIFASKSVFQPWKAVEFQVKTPKYNMGLQIAGNQEWA